MPSPLADPLDEGRRIVGRAAERGVGLRLLGGVAVALRCPSARRAPLARTFKDVDYLSRSKDRRAVEELFLDCGYSEQKEFNTLHGHQRLFFWDPVNEREADVFVDSMAMCHTLDLRDRLGLEEETIPLADLLLLKLQVVEVGERDLKDALALISDHPVGPGGIDMDYIARILSEDWGWWRTATLALEALPAFARELPDFEAADTVAGRVEHALAAIESTPKTRRWKMRARVGTRVRWYELPEEALG
jgi:hypothetical protein